MTIKVVVSSQFNEWKFNKISHLPRHTSKIFLIGLFLKPSTYRWISSKVGKSNFHEYLAKLSAIQLI